MPEKARRSELDSMFAQQRVAKDGRVGAQSNPGTGLQQAGQPVNQRMRVQTDSFGDNQKFHNVQSSFPILEFRDERLRLSETFSEIDLPQSNGPPALDEGLK